MEQDSQAINPAVWVRLKVPTHFSRLPMLKDPDLKLSRERLQAGKQEHLYCELVRGCWPLLAFDLQSIIELLLSFCLYQLQR